MELLKKKRLWLFLLLPLTMALTDAASRNPQMVEQYYSRGIYPILAGVLGRASALVPLSIAEVLLPPLLLIVLCYLARFVRGMVKGGGNRKRLIFSFTANLGCAAGVTYLLFALFCGLNYHRIPFGEQSGLDIHPSSTQELAALCTHLVQAANESQALVARDENGVMALSTPSMYDLAAEARALYPQAARVYPILSGTAGRPKPLFLSRGMSWLDLSGIYIPFTFEPNVNVDMPQSAIPSTMMHEISHFKGFMREQEANFLAYVACRESENPDFVYSGNLLALIHSTNALYGAERELYWEVTASLSDAVRRDLAYTGVYWSQFEGPVAAVATAVNDAYLKANLQLDGVKSYGEMVDLLLAEYRQMIVSS